MAKKRISKKISGELGFVEKISQHPGDRLKGKEKKPKRFKSTMLEWCIKKFVWQETTITFSSLLHLTSIPRIFSIEAYSLIWKKKNSKEKILDRIIEKMSKDGNYCIEHREGTKAFRLRKDKKQE